MIRNILVVVLFILNTAESYGQADSAGLVKMVRLAYQWHNRQITEDKGFDPRKSHARDTLYAGLDLQAVHFMISKYRNSGFFNEEFLKNYTAIAQKMNRELEDGSAQWREGDLPPFNHDADPWCNCADAPGTYWQKIKFTGVKIADDMADIHWTWIKGFSYHLKARLYRGAWKISYLEGYDSNRYRWAEIKN